MLNTFKNWLSAQLFADTTINNYYYAMKSFFENYKDFSTQNILEHINNLRKNFSIGNINAFIKAGKQYSKFSKTEVEFPKIKREEEKEPSYISEDDFLSLLDKLPIVTDLYVKYRAVLSILFYCGLRRQELVQLKRSDIDLIKNLIHINKSKTKKFRIVPFPKEAGKYISEYFGLEQENINAFNVSGNGIFFLCSKIKKMFGLKDFHPHTLRHSCIRYLLDKGIAPNQVMKISGHNSWIVFQTYTKCQTKDIINVYSKKIKAKIGKKGK